MIFPFNSAGDWKGVVRLYDSGYSNRRILWFQPDSHVLDFVAKTLSGLEVLRGVSSIGCGTGLLEWLIESVTGHISMPTFHLSARL